MPGRAFLFGIVGFGAAAAALAALIALSLRAPAPPPLLLVATPEAARPSPTRHAAIKVYVTGGVLNPGVYVLHQGDRADDAIRAAGGMTPDADPERVNLAAPLTDGQEVLVPRRGDPVPTPAHRGAAARSTTTGPINLNAATADELRQLPGIGTGTAQKIVDYRQQHGPFTRTDDVIKAGVRRSTYDNIKDRLTL